MINPISGTLPADWQERVLHRQINIYVGVNSTLIPQEYLVLNSIEITEKVCDSKFHLGGVIASRLNFTVNTDCITFGDDSLKVREHIVLDDNSEYDIPLGEYQIDRTDSIITDTGFYFEGKYVAYDSLVSMLDKEITKSDADEWALTANKALSNLLSFTAGKTGLALRSEDFSLVTASANNTATPNYQDGAQVGYLLDKAVELKATYRDLLSCIGALLCGAFITYRAETLQPYMRFVLLAPKTSLATLTTSDRISSKIDTQSGKAMIDEITFGDLSAVNPLSYPTNSKLSLSVGDNLLLPLPEEYNVPEIQGPAIVDMLAAVNCRIGNWTGYKSIPQKLGDPLVLTTADITYFGDPTIEAGDCITTDFQSGTSIDLVVMEHIYRLRQPSVIRSYGDANSVIYTSAYSPSYGETKRPTAYDAATAKQIAKLTEGVSNAETAIDNLSDDLTADEAQISDLSDRLDVVEEKIEKIVEYSTEERQIGCWINGEKLYEKSFVISDLGDSTELLISVDHNIDHLIEVVESRGQLISGSVSYPLERTPLLSDSSAVDLSNATSYRISSSAIIISKGNSDRSNDKAYITLRYLKNYKRVEYLKSTGTQYINTDIVPDYSYKSELIVMFSQTAYQTENSDYWYIFGISGAALNGVYCVQLHNTNVGTYPNSYIRIRDGYYSVDTSFTNANVASKNTLIMARPTSYYGNTSLSTNLQIEALDPPAAPIVIFGLKGVSGGVQHYYPFKLRDMYLYGFKMYDSNNTIIHNLLPVERDDGELGLLDEITEKFYTNAGTGTFEKGGYI